MSSPNRPAGVVGAAVGDAKAKAAGATRRPRHVPMRTCVGTGEKHPKRDMIRLVRTPDGHIVVDPTGKLSGSRGAYLSKQRTAAEAAIKNKRLEAEFEQAIAKEDADAILAYFSQFGRDEQ